jgi:Na+/alanine symporter
MFKYLKRHEKFIEDMLKEDCNWTLLSEYHKAQIEFLQHERLIHLIVTLAFGLFLLITVLFIAAFHILLLLPLAGLLFIMFIPYIIHYYHLENGVQRLYNQYNKIEERKGIQSDTDKK